MAKKYYAVKKGKKAGIYSTWNECKAQVDGFSGAIYKSFPTIEEAEVFIGIKANENGNSDIKALKVGSSRKDQNIKANESQKDKLSSNKETIIAYVDGSYNNNHKVYSGGAVILYEDKVYELSRVGNDSTLVKMRNVAGELLGVKSVVKWALDHKLKNILLKVHYDYAGIEHWANHEWKANKDGTKEYQKFISDFRKLGNEIEFVKVKAHSGVFYNEEADRLAAEAIEQYIIDKKVDNEKITIDKVAVIDKSSIKESPILEEKEVQIERNKDMNLNSYDQIFKKHIVEDNASASDFKITCGNLTLDEKNILKFIKNIWKSSGRLVKNIKKISIEIDMDNRAILWTIQDVNDEIHRDKYSIRS